MYEFICITCGKARNRSDQFEINWKSLKLFKTTKQTVGVFRQPSVICDKLLNFKNWAKTLSATACTECFYISAWRWSMIDWVHVWNKFIETKQHETFHWSVSSKAIIFSEPVLTWTGYSKLSIDLNSPEIWIL